jgi:hypothetical protein
MVYVYDVETFINCFTAVFVCGKDKREFVLHRTRDDRGKMFDFLSGVTGLVGYNNTEFDAPVLNHIYTLEYEKDPHKAAKKVYKFAQKLINEDYKDMFERKYLLEFKIPQLDLMKVWHFNNKAKMVSLKYLEINMGWHNVEDMPFEHTHNVKEADIKTILDYNTNDVMATYELYKRSADKINLRKKLSERFKMDMRNFNDVKIGEMIMLRSLCDEMGLTITDGKKLRTYRREIKLKDCLLPHISFESKEFNKILDYYQNTIITGTRKTQDLRVVFDDLEYVYGLGGLHACRTSGIYKNIKSADVSSYYPNLAISYGFKPHQFGDTFTKIYKSIYEERTKYPKGSDENAAFKLALNGLFGKSNSEYSAFYDPMFTMQITLNGQLLLSMLCERITLSGAGRIVMVNTDGIEVQIFNESKFYEVCDGWQFENNLALEYAEYKFMAIRDANAYLAVKDGGVKAKGAAFTIQKELYQDHSMRIIPMAIQSYFVNNVPIDKTIHECEDISLFLIGVRAKTGRFIYRSIVNSELVEQPLQKTLRYYMGDGANMVFKISDKKSERVHKNGSMVLFNQWVEKPFKEYKVDKQFYIREANKVLSSIMNQQL